MEIQLGGPSESETSLDNIQPTINLISEHSDTQSTVYQKVKSAETIQQAHTELGMSFTPNTSTETSESPRTKFCRQICYEVIDSDDAGVTDEDHRDLFVLNETRRFHAADLTPEVYEELSLIKKGLPPIETAFFRTGETVPTESPKPEVFTPEPYVVPHEQI